MPHQRDKQEERRALLSLIAVGVVLALMITVPVVVVSMLLIGWWTS